MKDDAIVSLPGKGRIDAQVVIQRKLIDPGVRTIGLPVWCRCPDQKGWGKIDFDVRAIGAICSCPKCLFLVVVRTT